MVKCKWCGKTSYAYNINSKYCSLKCRRNYEYHRCSKKTWQEKTKKSKIKIL